jgi:hypothetical protein
MSNISRSKAFIKIKHSIKTATNGLHLQSCRQMIENCTPICSKDEITILKEYILDAWDRVNPVGESFADELDSIYHKRLAANN